MPHPIAAGNRLEGRDCQGGRLRHRLGDATGGSTLMARLGHSSVRAAMIYQHATRDRDKVIAQALGGLIRQTAESTDQASAGGKENP